MNIYNNLEVDLKIIINNILISEYNKYRINIIRNRAISPMNEQCAICNLTISDNLDNFVSKYINWEIRPRKDEFYPNRFFVTSLYLNLCNECNLRTLNCNKTCGWDEWDAIDNYLCQIK